MSTFSKTNFKTVNYNSFRPQYPPSFYNILGRYVQKGVFQHQLPVERAIDLGCGTGVATYPLLNLAKRVIGLDLSPKMIETANSLVGKRLAELGVNETGAETGAGSDDKTDSVSNALPVVFKVGAVEDFINKQESGITEESVDLITAAECIHWFKDYKSFFQSSAQLLKKGGTLAYFFYVDPMIVNFTGCSRTDFSKKDILEKALHIYKKFAYEDLNYIGPYWEQPGRSILQNFCVDANAKIPRDLYEDIEIHTFKTSFDNSRANEKSDLDLARLNISLSDYIDYFETYSGFHSYVEHTGNADLLSKQFLNELLEATGWDLNETKIDLVWNTGYTFLRKK
ncbi:hypothetical protein KGF56_000430 [Candida oxycetoniae]|uniref:Methyltransferase type 11 domain-containing protein n=1 Tax=Candida oxycetoniae TaxID=497107 RepID=A0AAI9T2A2_9ASCO|nr:uncharacterized protein KGF56_000430 [Candida oxycetoniae]KAI3406825.2 hypothetical protein KGF56_000430 [Candida oxycetoniae]